MVKVVMVPLDEYLAPIRAEIAKAKADIENLTNATQSRMDIISAAEDKINNIMAVETEEPAGEANV